MTTSSQAPSPHSFFTRFPCRTFEVNLSKPFLAMPIFIRAIRDQQQVDIRPLMRIASGPRSDQSQGASIFTMKRPIGDCTHYSIDIGGFHRFQDIIVKRCPPLPRLSENEI
jgi:hypothetical protein